MRTVNQIQADISKLQAELEDVKVHEEKRNSACHILENLGWTHTPKFGWKQPVVNKQARPYDAEFDHPIKSGDYVKHINSARYYYVTAVNGHRLTTRELVKAINKGFICDHQYTTIRADFCKVVSPVTIKL